jgi:outer membrane protein assembly factor BamA
MTAYFKRFAAAFIFLFAAGVIHGAEYRLVIDEIKVDGAKALGPQEIDAAIEVDVGDYLERAVVARSVTNLENAFRAKGYRHVSVKSEVLKQTGKRGVALTVLRFVIDEGAPTRISSVDVVLSSLATKPEQLAWEKLKDFLLSKVSIKSGGVLDHDQVEEARKSLEAGLTEKEYIGGKIALTETPESDEATKLHFEVTLGDRVSFGFRGNSFFDRNQLLDLIAEQRTLGFGKDYIEDIREKIIDAYKGHGFAGNQASF